LLVQVHFPAAFRAAWRIFRERLSIGTYSRSILSAFARSAGCSLANARCAHLLKHLEFFSCRPLHISHQAQRDAVALRLLLLPQHPHLPQSVIASRNLEIPRAASQSSRPRDEILEPTGRSL